MVAKVRAFDWAIFQRGILKKFCQFLMYGRKKTTRESSRQISTCPVCVTDRRCWRKNAEMRDFRWILSSVTRRKTRSNVHRFLWKLRRPSRERHPPRSVTVHLAKNTTWNSRVVYSSRQNGRSNPPQIPSNRAWRNKDLFFWAEASIIQKWYIKYIFEVEYTCLKKWLSEK